MDQQKRQDSNNKPKHFSTVYLHSVPTGRRGKHHEIVRMIMEDLAALQNGTALRIPLESFGDQKLANVRAAVGRAARQRRMPVASASDGNYFYLWFEDDGDRPRSKRAGKRQKD